MAAAQRIQIHFSTAELAWFHTESLSRPTRQMSVGIGENPMGSNTSTALRFATPQDELLDDESVKQVWSAEITDGDAAGL